MQRNPQLPPVGANPAESAQPVNPYIMPVTEPNFGGEWTARQQRLRDWRAANPGRLGPRNGMNARPTNPLAGGGLGDTTAGSKPEFQAGAGAVQQGSQISPGAFNGAIPTVRPLGPRNGNGGGGGY